MIPSGTVHVWSAALDLLENEVRSLGEHLTEEERARASRFYFPRDARRWVVARATLRLLLGRYTDLMPRLLRFRLNPWGKPALDHPATEVCFNVSHSGDVALYAIATGSELGVDVEQVRDGRADDVIVKHFFSPREVSAWNALDLSARRDAFFRCWTRKEAYIKAVGRGLAIPLSSFDVSLGPGEPPALLDARDPSGRNRHWTFSEVNPGRPGYAAALAVEGPAPAVICQQWSAASTGASL